MIKVKYNKNSKYSDSIDEEIENQLQEQLKEMFEIDIPTKDKKNKLDLNILFSPKFIQKHTNNKFKNSEEFFGVINVFNHDDLDKIPQEIINKHISDNTKFKSLKEFFDNIISL